MWFNLEIYLLKSCLDNDVQITTPIYYQLIVLFLMCDTCLTDHTRPTSILITSSCVCAHLITPNRMLAIITSSLELVALSVTSWTTFWSHHHQFSWLRGFQGTLCSNMIITLTLKILAILDIFRRFTYHRFTLKVSILVSFWVRLLPGFRKNLMFWRKSKRDFYILS